MVQLSTQEDAGVLLVLETCKRVTHRVCIRKQVLHILTLYDSEFKISRGLDIYILISSCSKAHITCTADPMSLCENSHWHACQHTIVYSQWSIFSDDSVCFCLYLHDVLGLGSSCSPLYSPWWASAWFQSLYIEITRCYPLAQHEVPPPHTHTNGLYSE